MTKRQRWALVLERYGSAQALAGHIGSTRSTVGRTLNGDMAGPTTRAAIALALGTTPTALWPAKRRRLAAA